MKLCVIGAGNWGMNLIRNFCKILRVENITVVDIDKDKISKVEFEYPGINVSQNLDNILNNKEIKAVVIASPAETHYEIAKKSLNSNKHVFVEKPVTLSSKEAEELIEISEKKHLTLMVDHILIYHPAVKKLKELIKNKSLGKIYYIYSQRVNLGVIRPNENALWSLGPHDVSLYLYLLEEEPDSVSATGDVYIQKENNIEDTVFLHLHFPSGVDAHAHLSWLDPHKIRKLTVVGSKKMAVFDDMEPRNKLMIFDRGVEWTEERGIGVRYGDIYIPNISLKEPLITVCEHFIESIEKDVKPDSNGHDGLKVTRILEKAERAIKEKV
jgi:predicted dehydrogenase